MAKNSGKSVKDRLYNLAVAENYSPSMMFSRYMQERLIYRISISPYREKFVLKGGALLYAHDKFDARPTIDIDFMVMRINNDKENIKRIFQEICTLECEPDGTSFDAQGIETQDILVNKEYHGVQVSVIAHLDSAVQRISIDIGFGDVVTPAPEPLSFPTLIDSVPQAQVYAYSLETVVAEKFHAMIVLSKANSRMKDFYDVYRILSTNHVNPDILGAAIKQTFENRETSYVDNHPFFSEEFFSNPLLLAFWNGFMKKLKLDLDFKMVGVVLQEYLKPYWERLR